MCRKTQCSKCHKPTWAGCGAHVEQVLGDVRPADRCTCRETVNSKQPGNASAPRQNWLQKLLTK
jgi:hypothetical protein